MSNRGYRRDVLSVTEELVAVETADGPKRVPFHKANLMAIRAKASRGHAPSQRYLDKLHRDAVAAHELAHPKQFKMLEDLERMLFEHPPSATSGAQEAVNIYRRATRRP